MVKHGETWWNSLNSKVTCTWCTLDEFGWLMVVLLLLLCLHATCNCNDVIMLLLVKASKLVISSHLVIASPWFHPFPVIPSTIPSSIILQVQRRAEKKRARSFNELLEVDSAFLQEEHGGNGCCGWWLRVRVEGPQCWPPGLPPCWWPKKLKKAGILHTKPFIRTMISLSNSDGVTTYLRSRVHSTFRTLRLDKM